MKRCGLLLLLLVAAGCKPAGYAPVSGVVTLDGKPYGKAVVSFQPIAVGNDPAPGRGSSAYTDENGRFTLTCDGEIDGALTGRHRVRIMTRGGDVVGQGPSGVAGDGAPTERNVDPIPAEWNSLSEKEFEVPAGGTSAADFKIETKK